MSASLTKKEVIRDTNTIRTLMRTAPRVRNIYMSIRFLRNAYPYHRIIVLVQRDRRKIKGVLRNRMRRIGREIFRQSKERLPVPCGDIGLSLRESVLQVPHAERIEIFIDMVHQLAQGRK